MSSSIFTSNIYSIHNSLRLQENLYLGLKSWFPLHSIPTKPIVSCFLVRSPCGNMQVANLKMDWKYHHGFPMSLSRRPARSSVQTPGCGHLDPQTICASPCLREVPASRNHSPPHRCFIFYKLTPCHRQFWPIPSNDSCVNTWATRPCQGHSNVQKISCSTRFQAPRRIANLFIMAHAYFADKSHVVFVKHIVSCLILSFIQCQIGSQALVNASCFLWLPPTGGRTPLMSHWISTSWPWVRGVAHPKW